jgi:hypothetical protein
MRTKGILGSVFAVSLVFGLLALTANAQYGNGRYGGTDWNGYPNWGGSFDLRQTALNAGFNDGTSAGQKDASRGRRSNYNDFSQYRNATKDYNNRMGDRYLYQRYYRVAFEHGYDAQMNNGYNNNNGYYNGNNGYNNNNGNWDRDRDRNNGNWNNNGTWNNGNNNDWRNRQYRGRSWDQYGQYGGNSNFRQTALNAGYNEGINQGRKDRNRGPRNLNDFSQYRNANKDYNSREGDLGLYQRYYREGFENGYYDGLRGY